MLDMVNTFDDLLDSNFKGKTATKYLANMLPVALPVALLTHPLRDRKMTIDMGLQPCNSQIQQARENSESPARTT